MFNTEHILGSLILNYGAKFAVCNFQFVTCWCWCLCRQRHTLVLVSAVKKACRRYLPATSRWLSSATSNVCCSFTVAGPTCECASSSSISSTRTSRSRSVISGTRSSAASPPRSELQCRLLHYFITLLHLFQHYYNCHVSATLSD